MINALNSRIHHDVNMYIVKRRRPSGKKKKLPYFDKVVSFFMFLISYYYFLKNSFWLLQFFSFFILFWANLSFWCKRNVSLRFHMVCFFRDITIPTLRSKFPFFFLFSWAFICGGFYYSLIMSYDLWLISVINIPTPYL